MPTKAKTDLERALLVAVVRAGRRQTIDILECQKSLEMTEAFKKAVTTSRLTPITSRIKARKKEIEKRKATKGDLLLLKV